MDGRGAADADATERSVFFSHHIGAASPSYGELRPETQAAP